MTGEEREARRQSFCKYIGTAASLLRKAEKLIVEDAPITREWLIDHAKGLERLGREVKAKKPHTFARSRPEEKPRAEQV